MRAGTGGSLVHTERDGRWKNRMIVDTVLFRKERMETGGLGGSFYKL